MSNHLHSSTVFYPLPQLSQQPNMDTLTYVECLLKP